MKKFDKSVIVIFFSKLVAYGVNAAFVVAFLALVALVLYGFYLAFGSAGLL